MHARGRTRNSEGSVTVRFGVRDFEIQWISGGFLDFRVDFWISEWISGFQIGFLDFTVDFWISVWISADGVRDFFRDGPLEKLRTGKKAKIAGNLPNVSGYRGRILYTPSFERTVG